jgi:hypothetical protein
MKYSFWYWNSTKQCLENTGWYSFPPSDELKDVVEKLKAAREEENRQAVEKFLSTIEGVR